MPGFGDSLHPDPAEGTQTQSLLLPPPCSTVGMMFFWWCHVRFLCENIFPWHAFNIVAGLSAAYLLIIAFTVFQGTFSALEFFSVTISWLIVLNVQLPHSLQVCGSAWPTCQSLSHREGVHCGAGWRVNVVLLRHLVVQVEQHGVHAVEGIHSTAGRPAKIQGVHVDSTETQRLISSSVERNLQERSFTIRSLQIHTSYIIVTIKGANVMSQRCYIVSFFLSTKFFCHSNMNESSNAEWNWRIQNIHNFSTQFYTNFTYKPERQIFEQKMWIQSYS